MSPAEAVEHLDSALEVITCIDLRGRRAGTTFHTAVTTARSALEDAIDLLSEEVVA